MKVRDAAPTRRVMVVAITVSPVVFLDARGVLDQIYAIRFAQLRLRS